VWNGADVTQVWEGGILVDITQVIYEAIASHPTIDPILDGIEPIIYTCWRASKYTTDPTLQPDDAGWITLDTTTKSRCNGSDPMDPDPTNNLGNAEQTYIEIVKKKYGQISVKDIFDVIIDTPTGYGKPTGLDRTDSNVWSVSGGDIPQDVYIFIEPKSLKFENGQWVTDEGGKIKLNGTGGVTPWNVTIISTGAIEIVGSSQLTNYNDKIGLLPGDQDLFLFAETDIKTKGSTEMGSATEAIEGWIYAQDQVDLGGTAYIEGSILVKDQKESKQNLFDGLITESKVSGNFHLKYNDDIDFNLPGPVRILSWRECRVVRDPNDITDACNELTS